MEVVPFKRLDGQLLDQGDWPVAKTAGARPPCGCG
jgi:hypothetical protein